MPPLRERLGDLPALVDFFLRQAATKVGTQPPDISKEAMEKILEHQWPGNVRELQNKVHLACVLCRGGLVLPTDLELATEGESPIVGPNGPRNKDAVLAALRKIINWAWDINQGELWQYVVDMLERELLDVAWERLDKNQSQIAEKLGISWNTVSKKIKSYGLK
jgi:DNA-binding NtrC family response regulator